MPEAHANAPLTTDGPAPEAATPEPPKPEPWTPAKVVEWNAYYDIYVAVGVLLLAFLGSANRITQPSVWSGLHTGRTISATLTPVATDGLSYTEAGHRWVNIPWLTQVVHYQVFKLVSGFAPVDPNALVNSDAPAVVQARQAQAETAEQWGAAGLIVVDALVRTLTALVLLLIRRKGPGLWWSAVCVTLALGAVVGPSGLLVGGVAGPASVAPETWGQLFLAVELLILFRAYGQGRAGALYGLAPLFLLWANADESFFVGLLLLATAVVGSALSRRPRKDEVPRVPPARGLLILGLSAAACLLNPSHVLIYPAAIGTIVPWLGWTAGPLTPDYLSYFGKELTGRQSNGLEWLWVYFASIVGVGFVSFFLNRRNFSPARFLGYTVAAGLWAVAGRFRFEFAPVFAVTLALNGQEWYRDQFGTEGRLGRGWAVWSIGGRALTIVLVFVVLFKAVTGYDVLRKAVSGDDYEALAGEAQFGFGFDPDSFPFEAAEALRAAKVEGNVLNTSLGQGDALIWRAAPARKTFIDSRRHVFTADTIRKFDEVRKAIRDDDAETWRALLKNDNVSAVMIGVNDSPKTYLALSTSPDWLPFYDDGAVVMFGRSDAPAVDLAYFKSHRLDADRLVYKEPTPVPSPDKLPRATGDLDRIYQSRALARPQPHAEASLRWLQPADLPAGSPFIPDPARCLMAVREARTALARKADDATAYRRLAVAYRLLLLEESALIGGIKPLPENLAAIQSTSPQVNLLSNRFRQLVTALYYAVQTTPLPQSPEARRELANLRLQLSQYYAAQGFVDLARDELQAAIDLSGSDDFSPDQFVAFTQQLTTYNTQLAEVQSRLADLGLQTQAGPIQRAAVAQQAGAVGLAIQELKEAADAGMNPNAVKPALLDLYCQVGQPDKALELWTAGASADPILADGPGTAALRQGKVFLLLGNYNDAVQIWTTQALPQIKFQRALKATEATRSFLEGDPMATTRTFLELPEQVTTQALWEFDVALACLESGQPVDETAAHFTNALTLTPDLSVRPVIAYYLEKLGKPVPAPPTPPAAQATTTPAPTITPAK